MSTGISWTDETWNPTTGCSKVSEGCRNCYAAQLAPRLAAMGQTHAYTDLPWTKQNAAENVKLHEDRLEMPLRWKRPRRIFVNSMSDLFHELVPDEFIGRVFGIMAAAPHHTFQVLTKRPERMADVIRTSSWEWSQAFVDGLHNHVARVPSWPLPNVWLGTSVEDQRAADERISHLLRTPAAVRFLSCEPLIGPVDLSAFLRCDVCRTSHKFSPEPCDPVTRFRSPKRTTGGEIGWVIAGGESGPNRRKMLDPWARTLRDQCVVVGVPFFFKQHSGHRNEMDPMLDGREWREMPAGAS